MGWFDRSGEKPVETAETKAAHERARTTSRKATPKLENYSVESEGRRNNPGARDPRGYIER